jgi:Fic family protein
MKERMTFRLQKLDPGTLHRIVLHVARIDEFKGWWSSCGLSRASILSRLQDRSIAASAQAAARIRGADPGPGGPRRATSHAAAEERNRRSPEIEGYAGLLRRVFDRYREMKFDEALILEFHRRLLRDTSVQTELKGEYRSASAQARTARERKTTQDVALLPSAPDMIPDEMGTAVAWTATHLASAEFHPLLVVASFKLEFLAIHPFEHGNGRLSRVLTTLLLLQAGYAHVRYSSLDEIIARRWAEYFLALRRSQANRNLPVPDISAWLLAFLDALCAHATDLRTLMADRADERLLSRNQLGVLSLLERHGEVTNRLICNELGLPRETVKQVLNRLVALNLVRRAGAGRAVRYTLLLHTGEKVE